MKGIFSDYKFLVIGGILLTSAFVVVLFAVNAPVTNALTCNWQSCQDVLVNNYSWQCTPTYVPYFYRVYQGKVWVDTSQQVCSGYTFVVTQPEQTHCTMGYWVNNGYWTTACSPVTCTDPGYSADVTMPGYCCNWIQVWVDNWQWVDQSCYTIPAQGYYVPNCYWVSSGYWQDVWGPWIDGSYWDYTSNCQLVVTGQSTQTQCTPASQTCPADYCSTATPCNRVSYSCGATGCVSSLVPDNSCTNICSPPYTCSSGLCISPNQPPNKPDTSAGETWNNCGVAGESIPIFSWIYSDPNGNPQAAYEVEVDDNSGFHAPMFNHVVNSASTSYSLNLSQDDTPDWISSLAWNTTYFWRVRVEDNQGNWSDWSNSDTFKTPNHAYPSPSFSWTPQQPAQGEVAVFNPDASQVYGGTAISTYDWNVTSGTGTFVSSTDQYSRYPSITFNAVNNTISLTITDTDGYSCQSSDEAVTSQYPLPEYKETPPVSMIHGFIASASEFLTSIFFQK